MIQAMPDSPVVAESLFPSQTTPTIEVDLVNPNISPTDLDGLVNPNLSLTDLDGFKSPNSIIPSRNKQGSKKDSGALSSSRHLSPNERRRRKRLVKFNKVVHNRRITHLNDLSDELISATWIQPEEYLDIRERCITTVKKMMEGALTDEELENEELCPRGLEGKTREGSSVRRDHKLDSIAAVIDEQTLQWNEEVLDEEAIMGVYALFSIPCAEAAHTVALQDAEAAIAYQHSIEEPPSEAQHSTVAPASPVAAVEPGVVDRLKDILFQRSNKAALLQDVEAYMYNESAMERRRKVYEKPVSNVLASQLRQYFTRQATLASGGKRKGDDVPSLSPSQCSDSTETEEDDTSSSSSSNGPIEDAHDSCVFTSQLQSHFSSRTKRQALLKSIESAYFEENETTIVTIAASTSSVVSMASANVAAISNNLGILLQDIFSIQSHRRAVVDQLKANTHHRQHNW